MITSSARDADSFSGAERTGKKAKPRSAGWFGRKRLADNPQHRMSQSQGWADWQMTVCNKFRPGCNSMQRTLFFILEKFHSIHLSVDVEMRPLSRKKLSPVFPEP